MKAGRAAALVKRVEQERVTVSAEADEREIEVDDEEPSVDAAVSAASPVYDEPASCAATVQGVGQCKTPRGKNELFCRRHLDALKISTSLPMPQCDPPKDAVPVTCSVSGCKKPKHPDSVQCERHYKKALRNNTKYPVRAKQAMNGTAAGSWKDLVLGKLFEQREIATRKVADIDQTIMVVKGL